MLAPDAIIRVATATASGRDLGMNTVRRRTIYADGERIEPALNPAPPRGASPARRSAHTDWPGLQDDERRLAA